MKEISPAPRLTVFTTARETAADCAMVLGELQRQTARAELEVIIVAPDREGFDDQDFACFGAWRLILLPEVNDCGTAAEAAVHAARAPVITYAEEHAYLDEAWAERLMAAHDAGYDVVGYAMENANPGTLVSWAHFYGQFGPVCAPAESGVRDFLAGHHASYRRDLLLEYGPKLRAMMEDECVMFLDFRRRGIPMYLAGDAVSQHVNISSLPAYMHLDFLGQRSFASTRAAAGNWPWWKRLAYAGACPLIPFVRLQRILRDIRRTGRRHLLPRILGPMGLALLAGAWGEMLGYLTGGGDSATLKAPAELQREQFLARSDTWTKVGKPQGRGSESGRRAPSPPGA